MSYLALARKYRPRRFQDVRGQEHAVRALAHALDADRLHPALLLTGTRGIGKTTLGRLIAKGLNCERGVSSKPCGECSACRELDEGRFVDLIEIDAASRTKVDDTRQLLDNVAYTPVRGRYKVYLVDEVHMLSTSSFNALLKTLEEPPPHVKFVLATTDPQKLPMTVLSRCLQFSLKRLPTAAIRQAFAEVLAAEGLRAQPAALAELARAADGSMRDGLSLLDQAIAYAGGEEIGAEMVEQMLGGVGRRQLTDLLQALAAGDGERLLAALRNLEDAAPDYAALLDTVAGALQRIAALQTFPGVADEDDDPALIELSRDWPAEDVQLAYEIAVHGRRDLPWAPTPRVGFEMALLRMYAFRPETSPAPAAAPAAAAPRPSSAASPPPSSSATPPPADAASWATWAMALPLDGLVRQLALNCAFVSASDSRLVLALAPARAHLLTEERRRALERALAAAGVKVALEIQIGQAPVESPAAAAARAEAEAQRQAQAAIEQDATVRALRETFGARLRPESVQALRPGATGPGSTTER